MRQTKQRTEIERIFQDFNRPLGPQEIHEIARKSLTSINLATIYRTLNRMLDEEVIVAVGVPGEPDRYELKKAAATHHHHFRCEKCQTVYDLQGCVENLKAMLPNNFSMTSHDIWLYGICKDCN